MSQFGILLVESNSLENSSDAAVKDVQAFEKESLLYTEQATPPGKSCSFGA